MLKTIITGAIGSFITLVLQQLVPADKDWLRNRCRRAWHRVRCKKPAPIDDTVCAGRRITVDPPDPPYTDW